MSKTQADAVNWLNSQVGQHLDIRPCNYPGVREGYFVSEHGKIISTLKGKFSVMTNSAARGGYSQVCMTMESGKTLSIKTHRLVAQAFIPNPNNLRTVNHKDENKLNNDYHNLEWLSTKDNNYYSKQDFYTSLKGKGVANKVKVTLEDIEDMKLFREKGVKLRDISNMYGIALSYVCNLTRSNARRAA